MEIDDTMQELIRIKEELSLRYVSQTPEENARDAREARATIEKRLGRKLPTADYSKHREVARAELVQV